MDFETDNSLMFFNHLMLPSARIVLIFSLDKRKLLGDLIAPFSMKRGPESWRGTFYEGMEG